MAQLRAHKSQFDQLSVQIVLIGMGTQMETEAFRREFDLSYPFICDPEKKLYAAFGLAKAGLKDFTAPRMLLKSIQAISQGHLPAMPTGDPMQTSGTFIIDTDGRFLVRHYAKDLSDHLPIESMLETVRLHGVGG